MARGGRGRAGLLVGVPLALVAGPLVGALLYGVAPNDPVMIGPDGVI